MVDFTFMDHPLSYLLLLYHMPLHGRSSAVHDHFAVLHGLFVPDQCLRAHLNHALVIVSFSYNRIISAVRSELEMIKANRRCSGRLWFFLPLQGKYGKTQQCTKK
jgi:hypothetical protein